MGAKSRIKKFQFIELALFIVLLILILNWGCSKAKEELHIVTFNVRYDNPNDGPNSWEMRIPVIESYFTKESPDIIGMQEVKHNQIIDLQKILPGFDYVGTGRDDRICGFG